jgi:hypothetical protein
VFETGSRPTDTFYTWVDREGVTHFSSDARSAPTSAGTIEITRPKVEKLGSADIVQGGVNRAGALARDDAAVRSMGALGRMQPVAEAAREFAATIEAAAGRDAW